MKHRFSILFFMLLLISGMCVYAQTHSYASFMMADHAMPGDPSVARH